MSEKRPYTMSDAALEQRRAAAAKGTAASMGHHTGPVTEEGKAAVSRNAWKHGLYSVGTALWRELGYGMRGKPCLSTCQKYPCDLVQSGVTEPGKDCLDRTVYLEAFDALMDTMHSGDVANAHGLLASQVAGALEILNQLREEIAEKGVVIYVPMFNKAGDQTGSKPEANPALFHYVKLLGDLGINLAELMATPRAVKGAQEAEDANSMMAALVGGALARAGGGPVRRNRIIPVVPELVEDGDA